MTQPAPIPNGIRVEVAHKTDPGLDPDKQVNEDAFGHADLPLGHLLVVCDGMGGHMSGREASERAVQTILGEIEAAPATASVRTVLAQSIQSAGRAVYEIGGPSQHQFRPGSTCVALLVHSGGTEVAHVGDSRAYVIRGGQIYPLTRDHSMVQQMIDAGVLGPEQAAGHPDANKITRALGMAPEVEVELRPAPVDQVVGDIYLLATDGLCDLVAPHEMLSTVGQAEPTRGLGFIAEQLVALANARGGHDNITVLLAKLIELGPQALPCPTAADGSATAQETAGPILTVPAMPALDRPVLTTQVMGPAPTLMTEDPPQQSLGSNFQSGSGMTGLPEGVSGTIPDGMAVRYRGVPESAPDESAPKSLSASLAAVGVLLTLGGLALATLSIWWMLSREKSELPESLSLQASAIASTTEGAEGALRPDASATAPSTLKERTEP